MPFVIIALITLVFLICAFLVFYKFVFLRDPERKIPKGSNIVSPADGKIISIIQMRQPSVRVTRSLASLQLICSDVALHSTLVSIFMSPLNVHVNRIPCDATVASVKYIKGSFLKAFSLKALQNERNEILLRTNFGNIKVIQIAGFLARRIECWIKPNQKLIKGFRFGRINLGSQVVIVLPSKLKIRVIKGQKVSAGETIIAQP
jgi:phosphatidylserine decarboxylase